MVVVECILGGYVWMQNALHEMTGGISSESRAEIWDMPHKRIFFCTPQTFKNDVCRGERAWHRSKACILYYLENVQFQDLLNESVKSFNRSHAFISLYFLVFYDAMPNISAWLILQGSVLPIW